RACAAPCAYVRRSSPSHDRRCSTRSTIRRHARSTIRTPGRDEALRLACFGARRRSLARCPSPSAPSWSWPEVPEFGVEACGFPGGELLRVRLPRFDEFLERDLDEEPRRRRLVMLRPLLLGCVVGERRQEQSALPDPAVAEVPVAEPLPDFRVVE